MQPMPENSYQTFSRERSHDTNQQDNGDEIEEDDIDMVLASEHNVELGCDALQQVDASSLMSDDYVEVEVLGGLYTTDFVNQTTPASLRLLLEPIETASTLTLPLRSKLTSKVLETDLIKDQLINELQQKCQVLEKRCQTLQQNYKRLQDKYRRMTKLRGLAVLESSNPSAKALEVSAIGKHPWWHGKYETDPDAGPYNGTTGHPNLQTWIARILEETKGRSEKDPIAHAMLQINGAAMAYLQHKRIKYNTHNPYRTIGAMYESLQYRFEFTAEQKDAYWRKCYKSMGQKDGEDFDTFYKRWLKFNGCHASTEFDRVRELLIRLSPRLWDSPSSR
ncbi:hypothetical protein H2200_010651 [Cladophialophora chaetospira]|uniref:Uncharacterized protein n=1 Tax=Cladophialophora chaetospira TaxID=386627 RepID=A0AA39CDQ8_9EURO|nr:hypothetical protein H2200_010651 [Cladophialophora chaetospira]